MSTTGDVDPIETVEWVDALSAVQQYRGNGRTNYLINRLVDEGRRRASGFGTERSSGLPAGLLRANPCHLLWTGGAGKRAFPSGTRAAPQRGHLWPPRAATTMPRTLSGYALTCDPGRSTLMSKYSGIYTPWPAPSARKSAKRS